MYLFIDTETTGLPTRRGAHYTEHSVWPRIVSISWALLTPSGKQLEQAYSIVRPDGFTIPPEAARIHGITTAQALAEGRPLKDVLLDLAPDVKTHPSQLLIAHNVEFDLPIVLCEFHRLGLAPLLEGLPTYCTMQNTISYCAIPDDCGYGYKWPTLAELYHKLFAEGFEGEHDAARDVQACVRCYFRLVELGLTSPKPNAAARASRSSPAQDLLDTIYDYAADHPNFNTGFVDSLQKQLENRSFLTANQLAALRNIIRKWRMG